MSVADPSRSETRARLFGIPILDSPTGREASAFDQDSIDRVGVPQATLMENAGRAAALVLERLHPRGTVTGLVGGGNNGGDAMVALRSLASWGRPVRAVMLADRDPDPRLHGWSLSTRRPGSDASEDGMAAMLADADLVLDGLLGTGIRGAPRELQARAIRAVNRTGVPVLALDVPSGVDADTGAAPGVAVDADVTVCFGWPKLGVLLPPGRDRAGRVIAVEIGFPPQQGSFGQAVLTPGWARAQRPARPSETHKYAAGSLLLVAGGVGMAGAAVLAGRAAQRAGLGILFLASSPENRQVLQTTVPEAVFIDITDGDALAEALGRASALAVGPGLGRRQEVVAALDVVLGAGVGVPTVLDADALTLSGSGATRPLRDLGRERPLVLTPHTGELERITEFTRDDAARDRVAVARETAAQLGAVVVLKGIPSVVASSGGRVLVDVVGRPDLATGGMGDVLTGAVGSFLAQGAAPVDAAGLGLYYSGRAAALTGRGSGLIPDDVVDALPDAIQEEPSRCSDLDLPFVVFDLGSRGP